MGRRSGLRVLGFATIRDIAREAPPSDRSGDPFRRWAILVDALFGSPFIYLNRRLISNARSGWSVITKSTSCRIQ